VDASTGFHLVNLDKNILNIIAWGIHENVDPGESEGHLNYRLMMLGVIELNH
jgi:hypothetical protein